jgi:ATP-dependent RNA helicase RhlE
MYQRTQSAQGGRGPRSGRPSNTKSTSTSSRPSQGSRFGAPRSGSSRPGAPRSGGAHFSAQRGRTPQRAKQRGGGEYIDPSRFINTATRTNDEPAFVPVHSFSDFAIANDLKHAVKTRGYESPTPIQDGAIPHILEGKDIIGIANTGTGKTGAFLVPLIDKVRKVRGEQVLIIVPTRELAIQIEEELRLLTKGLKIFSVCAVGGVNITPQLRALRQRNEFVIGTPGRLKDLVERKALHLTDYATIVLDEADRMLDMGFIDDMRFIMERMPKPRQTLFFSATLSPDIERLVGQFLTNPVRVMVKKRDTSKNVHQDVVRVAQGADKVTILHALLADPEFGKVLVFGRTKHGVEKLATVLGKMGVRAESIHGNKSHGQRQRALQNFKQNRVQVLVATDVAARGLDIPQVTHVINFDLPNTYDDYVHRIGRTGRADQSGKALTFVESR